MFMYYFYEIMNLFKKIEPNIFFDVVKLAAKLTFIWPLNDDAKKRKIYFNCFMWWFTAINFLLLLVPSAISMYKFRNNISMFSVSWMETTVLLENTVCILVCKIQRRRLKTLLDEFDDIIIYVSKRRHATVNKILINVTKLYVLNMTFFMIIVFLYLYNMQTTWPKLPAAAWYPFSIANVAVNYLLLAHQLYVILLCIVNLIVDGLCFAVLYTAIAKLDIVKQHYRKAHTYTQLVIGICSHEQTMWYVEECKITFRFIILKTIVACFGYFVTGGFSLLNPRTSNTVFRQFILIMSVSAIRLYVYSATADQITEAHEQLKAVIYGTEWYRQSKHITQALLITMHRCQKAIKITYSNIVPSLDLNFYATYIYMNFSYFMTLRAIRKKLYPNDF